MATTIDSAPAQTAVVIVNLGSTAAPTTSALRRFLGEFLSDRRIVDLPRLIWYPILYGIILTFRPRKLVSKYASIWMTCTNGAQHPTPASPESCERFQSPLLVYTTSLAKKLEVALTKLNRHSKDHRILVRDAMTYGEYNRVEDVLTELHQSYPTVKEVIVLPLFAQYTSTTVACVFDTFFRYYGNPSRRCLPGLRMIRDYPVNHAYIEAVGQSIFRALKAFYGGGSGHASGSQTWLQSLRAAMPNLAIVLSFHSIPCRYAVEGDDYISGCESTVTALQSWLECALAASAQADGSNQSSTNTWNLDTVLLHVYQSQFGKMPWLGPSLETAMSALPAAAAATTEGASPHVETMTTASAMKQALVSGMETFYSTRQVLKSVWSSKVVKDCIVLTPGFGVDCIETLVEVNDEARETFMAHGGARFEYVPCLNDSDDHVGVLISVLQDATRLPL